MSKKLSNTNESRDPRDNINEVLCILRMLEELTGEGELQLTAEGNYGLWLTLRQANETLKGVTAQLDKKERRVVELGTVGRGG